MWADGVDVGWGPGVLNFFCQISGWVVAHLTHPVTPPMAMVIAVADHEKLAKGPTCC
jgi:hypothetical protein